MVSLCPCSSSKLHYFVLSSGILECNWQGKSRAQSQERIDFSAQTSQCTCVLCTVSWQPQPTDVRRFTAMIHRLYRQGAPSTSDLTLLPWILWWHTTLALWRTHKPTQSQKSTLFSTLSTWINLHWLIKRLLKIRLVLGKIETNNAEQGSKHNITWGARSSERAEDWQDEVRIVAKNQLCAFSRAVIGVSSHI